MYFLTLLERRGAASFLGSWHLPPFSQVVMSHLPSSLWLFLSLLLPSSTFKGPQDDIGCSRIIWNNLPVLTSATSNPPAAASLPFPCDSAHVLGIRTWTPLGGPWFCPPAARMNFPNFYLNTLALSLKHLKSSHALWIVTETLPWPASSRKSYPTCPPASLGSTFTLTLCSDHSDSYLEPILLSLLPWGPRTCHSFCLESPSAPPS